ncbi:hypothetical protein llap_18920 [Limosa lapponica baueri]|uniref:Secreted protein n=1 Tax=Limosa lapponica baueri TaxID=1758121 RepID=A0A2I0TAE9_LIMLA|nr:hypothetical protein llap_18920 [Limosa lapponica baueri]
MLILLAFIIVFHITSAALLFISTIDNVSLLYSLFLSNTQVFLCFIKMKKAAEENHPRQWLLNCSAPSAELLLTGHGSAPLLAAEVGKARNCISNQGCFCFCRVSINSGCSGHHDPIYYFLLCGISGFHSPTLPSKARRKICANLYYPAPVM